MFRTNLDFEDPIIAEFARLNALFFEQHSLGILLGLLFPKPFTLPQWLRSKIVRDAEYEMALSALIVRYMNTHGFKVDIQRNTLRRIVDAPKQVL